MKKNIILFVAAAIAIVMCACGDGQKKVKELKDRSIGGTAEILVVTQNAEQWDGMIGDSIRAFFLKEQYGLPQPESEFKLSQLNVSGFSEMFRKHKNILIVEINPKLEKVLIEGGQDLWAKPQRVIKISAPSRQTWIEAFDEHKETYKVMFLKVEYERIMNLLRQSADPKIMNAIQNKFGFSLTIPESFFIAKSEPDFMWIRREMEKIGMGFFIYSVPYHDTIQLEGNSLINMRNKFMQEYVPGPANGSFMSTDREFMPPQIKSTSNFVTSYAIQSRGMWNLVGDYMAGPFIAYSFVDSQNKLVTVEGYVYAPNQDKRNHLLQMEAILHSLKFNN